MSDDLRSRIAAVVDRHGSKGNDCWCGWEWKVGDESNHHGHHLADAVIRELEAGYVLVPKNVTLVQWADEAFKGQPEGNFKHEHVTEWAADA